MALLKSINVPLGTKAIDFCLKDVDGEMHSLAEYDDKDILVIVIMCNPTPILSRASLKRITNHSPLLQTVCIAPCYRLRLLSGDPTLI